MCYLGVLHHAMCCDALTQAPARAPEHMLEIEVVWDNNQALNEPFLIRQVSTPAAGTASCLDSQSEWEVALPISFSSHFVPTTTNQPENFSHWRHSGKYKHTII